MSRVFIKIVGALFGFIVIRGEEGVVRLHFSFRVYPPKLPIIYRHRLMALIKSALEKADRYHKRNLYPEGKEDIKTFLF